MGEGAFGVCLWEECWDLGHPSSSHSGNHREDRQSCIEWSLYGPFILSLSGQGFRSAWLIMTHVFTLTVGYGEEAEALRTADCFLCCSVLFVCRWSNLVERC